MILPTRRALVGAALAAAAASLALPSRREGSAAAPRVGKQAPGIYRYRIGACELTALSDGVWDRPIDDRFVRNAAPVDVRRAMNDAYMPAADRLPTPFTALMVNTGRKLVLIDAGSGGQITPTAGTLTVNLAAAGIEPRMIDTILISHFHPDHISGLKTKERDLVFPAAEVLVPAGEWAFWINDDNLRAAPEALKLYFLNARRIFGSIAHEVKQFEWEREIVPGITAIAAPGHTPGHTAFAVASGGDSLLVLSDTANHPALFVRLPQWQAVFDMDGDLAVDTRKSLLEAASERMLVAGYHFPFPACGYIARRGSGYEFVPVQWQPTL